MDVMTKGETALLATKCLISLILLEVAPLAVAVLPSTLSLKLLGDELEIPLGSTPAK